MQPATSFVWRKEISRSYAVITILAVFFAFLFTVLFYQWKEKSGFMDLLNGNEFGALCSLSFAIPVEIGNADYINYSPEFVTGNCISALVEYTVNGIIASLLL